MSRSHPTRPPARGVPRTACLKGDGGKPLPAPVDYWQCAPNTLAVRTARPIKGQTDQESGQLLKDVTLA